MIDQPKQFRFTVGRYLDPQPEENLRYIDFYTDAIAKAHRMSESYQNEIIAIWNLLDEVVAIYINGNKFTPCF